MPITEKLQTLYVCSDGNHFIDKEQAQDYELGLQIVFILDKFYFRGIDVEEIAKGIVANRALLLEEFNNYGKIAKVEVDNAEAK